MNSTKIFLANLALIGLIFGMVPFMQNGSFSNIQKENFTQVSGIKIAVTEFKTAAQSTQIAPAQVLPAAFSCQNALANQNTFVQGQASLNLNQPASCFSLSLAALPQLQTRLAVRPLMRIQQRITVLPFSSIATDFFRTLANFPQTGLPAVPTSAVLAAASLIIFSSIVLNGKKKLIRTAKARLSAAQFQIMRC